MEQAQPRNRRRHGVESKKIVLAECAEPGASVASVALEHGLNASLVHYWRRLAHSGDSVANVEGSVPSFVPIALPQPSAAREDIRVELRRGPSTVTVTGPVAAATECAAWMREPLR